jgi:hypothetical protein
MDDSMEQHFVTPRKCFLYKSVTSITSHPCFWNHLPGTNSFIAIHQNNFKKLVNLALRASVKRKSAFLRKFDSCCSNTFLLKLDPEQSLKKTSFILFKLQCNWTLKSKQGKSLAFLFNTDDLASFFHLFLFHCLLNKAKRASSRQQDWKVGLSEYTQWKNWLQSLTNHHYDQFFGHEE